MTCLDFAKSVLEKKRLKWHTFPLYFYTTGRIRSLPSSNRTNLLSSVSVILSNTSFNPFQFNLLHSVSVLSGEQEGIYTWLAANYQILLHQHSQQITNSKLQTLGNVELNFISSHIAFQLDLPDTLEHTFEIPFAGGSLPLYSMSYLSYGYNTLQDQYIDYLTALGFQGYIPHSAVIPSILDYCFYSGYRESFQSPSPSIFVEIYGPSVPAQDAMERCLSSLKFFLTTSKSTTHLHQRAPEEECGLWKSVYQPSLRSYNDTLPNEPVNFIGTGLISYASSLLHLHSRWTLVDWRNGAKKLCSMSFHDVMIYATSAEMTIEDQQIYNSLLPSSCLLSCYIYLLLQDGYGFNEKHVFSTRLVSASMALYPSSSKPLQINPIWGALIYHSSDLSERLSENESQRGNIFSFLFPMFIGAIIGIISTYIIFKRTHSLSYTTEKDDSFDPPMMMCPSHQVYQEIVDQEANGHHDISSYDTLDRTLPSSLFPSTTLSATGEVNGSL